MDLLQVRSPLTNYSNCLSAKLYSQRLARFLDRPLFPWKSLLVGFYVGQYALETFLDIRQYGILQRKIPPKSLQAEIKQETFDKSQVLDGLLVKLAGGFWQLTLGTGIRSR